MSLTERQIRSAVWYAAWRTQGREPTPQDYAYWVKQWPDLEARGIELNNPEYAQRRLLGMGTSGADVPKFGEYANPPTPYLDVPLLPNPWADSPTEPAPSAPSPAPRRDAPDDTGAGLAALLASLERIVDGVTKMAENETRIAAALEQLAAKGVRFHF